MDLFDPLWTHFTGVITYVAICICPHLYIAIYINSTIHPVEKASVKLLAWVIMNNIAIDCYTVIRLVAGLLEVLLDSKFNTTCTYMYV